MASGSLELPFSYTISANNGPTGYSATGLPLGLSLDSATGVISGTPLQDGYFAVAITASNSGGTGTAILDILIGPPALGFTSAQFASGQVGTAFSYQTVATQSPQGYGASGLPPGLMMNPESGLISGTPTGAGVFTSTVTAMNTSGTGSFLLTVAIAPAASNPDTADLDDTYGHGLTITDNGSSATLYYDGQSGYYSSTVTIYNPSSETAEGVSVTWDYLPTDSTTPVSTSHAFGSLDPDIAYLGSIASGTSVTLRAVGNLGVDVPFPSSNPDGVVYATVYETLNGKSTAVCTLDILDLEAFPTGPPSSGVSDVGMSSGQQYAVPTLSQVEILGPDRVDENTSTGYTVEGIMSDGTTVTPPVNSWVSTLFSISAEGELAAGSVDGGDSTTTLTASITVAGITQSGSKLVTVADTAPRVQIVVTGSDARRVGEVPGTFAVSRIGATTAPLTVSYQVIQSGTNVATEGVDYQSLPGEVTIPAGSSSATIQVQPIDDGTLTPDETVTLALSSSSALFYSTIDSQATLTIIGSVAVQFSASSYSVRELGSVADIPVERLGDLTSAVSVGYNVMHGTAKPGIDFTLTSGTLNFPSGVAEADIPLQSGTDRLDNAVKNLSIDLTNPQGGASLGEPTLATISLVGAYKDFAGIFTGLVGNGNGDVVLTVSAKGTFTGKVTLSGGSYAIHGAFDANGNWTGSVGRPPVQIQLHIDLNATGNLGEYLLSGTAGDESFDVTHAAYSTGEIAAETGDYTVLLTLSGSNPALPQGTGYATLKVTKTGAITMSGDLADGERFSTSGVVVGGTDADQFVVYVPLSYPSVVTRGDKGLLEGAVMFEKLTGTSDLSGTVEWTKPQQTKGAYPAAIDTNLNVIGSFYTPPPKKGSVLPGFPVVGGTTEGTLELSDTSGPILSGSAQLSTKNKLDITNPPDKLTISITPSTGVFTGSFLYPVAGKRPDRIKFGGVLFQDQIMGGGFFLGPNGSGTVSLAPPP